MSANELARELQEMVNKDGIQAARWAHAFADSIDNLNEAIERLEEIKEPCPFCNSGAVLVKSVIGHTDDQEYYEYWVQCRNRECNAKVCATYYGLGFQTAKDAVKAWDRRGA